MTIARGNYWDYSGIVQNQTYQMEFTARIVQNTTYWATMSVNSVGGYGGIQQWNSSNPATDHGGLFSLWDSTPTTSDSFVIGYNPYVTFKNYSFRFGGEGTGAQLLFYWPWQVDKPYRMAWRRYVEPGNTMARYEGFYFDPYDGSAGGWVWVGTINKPVNTDTERNMQGFESFSEAYGGNTNLVRLIDIRNVWLLDMTNRWKNITMASMTDARDNGVLTALSGGWQHRSYNPGDVFTAINNLPMQPASDLKPIYLPYRINCGWGSTNNATSAQVAASLNRAFEPDAFWYGSSATNYTGAAINLSGVDNAATSSLYQSRREGTNFGYKLFGLYPGGQALVRLHFAETDFNTAGTRLENILINGANVETNLDIYALAGAQNRALVRNYTANVGTDGIVNISFQSQNNVVAVISGIEVNSYASMSNVVAGVSQITAGSSPGAVVALATNWIAIAAGDTDTTRPSTFILTRQYGAGRVVITGHDGLLADNYIDQLDNAKIGINLFNCLNVAGSTKVGYTTGHGEWEGGNLTSLAAMLNTNGYTFNSIAAPLTGC